MAKAKTSRPAAKPGKDAAKAAPWSSDVDALFTLDDEIREVSAQLAALEERKKAAQQLLLASMKAQGLESLRTERGTIGITRREVASIKDWESFTAYVRKANAFDLLQSRVSIRSLVERRNAGETVPGVAVETIINLSMHRSRA